MHSTQLFTEDVVMGSEEKLFKVILSLKNKGAELIGIISGALSHLRGEDLERILKEISSKLSGISLFHLPLSDDDGSAEQGYAKCIEKVINLLPEERGTLRTHQVNVLAGFHLIPADFHELRRLIRSFGLNPIFLPDLSILDGSRGYAGIPKGGTSLSQLERFKKFYTHSCNR